MSKNDLWFKAKKYGWGWVPVTWQGWLTVLLFVVVIFLGSAVLLTDQSDNYGPVLAYVAWVVLCSLVLVGISYKHGEEPRWRWGDKDEPKR